VFEIIMSIVNLILVILLAPLYEGVLRKVKAIVHSRIGPPIYQPYLDIIKLLGKEDLRVSNNILIGLAPIVCFASIMMVALLTPIGSIKAPLGGSGDVIVLIYFISLAAFSIMIGAAATTNVYAFIGLTRKMMLYLVLETIIVLSILTGVVRSGSFNISDIVSWNLKNGPTFSMLIAAIPFFLVMQAQLAKLPFDIAEAEQEIMEGPFIEASGPRLALFKWSFFAKQIIYASLFLEIFLPWPKTMIIPIDIIINLVKVLIVIFIIGVIDVVNPRLRVDQAIKYYTGVSIIALIALAFAIIRA
jgi:formate hydrogenlyase subunit 4